MKSFEIDVDFTFSKSFFIDAESEDEAKEIVNNMIEREPYYYARKADVLVGHEITDVYEN